MVTLLQYPVRNMATVRMAVLRRSVSNEEGGGLEGVRKAALDGGGKWCMQKMRDDRGALPAGRWVMVVMLQVRFLMLNPRAVGTVHASSCTVAVSAKAGGSF